jgi:hypothetical protein
MKNHTFEFAEKKVVWSGLFHVQHIIEKFKNKNKSTGVLLDIKNGALMDNLKKKIGNTINFILFQSRLKKK